MKKKILLSPLIILVIIALAGVSLAGASLLIGNSGDNSATTAIDLQRGLVGNWKLDGNANDFSAYRNNGTVTGATLTTDRKGQANKAYSFDGSSNIDFGNGSSLDATTAITVSVWVNPTNTSSGQRMIATHGRLASGVADDTSWHLWQDGANLYFRISDDVTLGTVTYIGNPLVAGQWTNVIFRFNGSAGTKAVGFVNGVQTGNSYNGVSTLSTNPWRDTIVIGADGDKTSKFFVGSIDDVRIYNRALSQTEITALYQEYNPSVQISDLQKGLVGQWKMDGNANDFSAYRNNGTVTGATLTIDRKGQANKAYLFNGTTDIIVTSATVGSQTGYTASAWIYPTVVASSQIVNKYIGSAAYSQLGLTASGQIAARIHQVKDVDFIGRSTSASTIAINNWYHIVTTWDGTTTSAGVKIYVNGVQKDTGNNQGGTFTAPYAGTVTTNIGAQGTAVSPSALFTGTIDDVRIYNRALSQTEITALYQEYNPSVQISDLQKGLVGNWKMDGNANDFSAYRNNGTVTGATLNTDRKGQINKAYDFNGTSDHISTGNVGTGIKTIAFWMQADDTTTRKIIDIDGTDQIELDGSSAITATSFPGTTIIYVDGVLASAISDTNWHFVAITDTTGVTPSAMDIGAVSTSYFDGKLDDVRIYNRALTTTEVADLYNSY